MGMAYYNATLPETGSADVGSMKKGEAMCTSILALVAQGDCSIEAAKAQGGIKRVAYVDRKVENILGIYGKYTTIVYGD
ncbi:MAG: hypothetical protein IPK66_09170 [Rhodospirillales bacterium]|nr:hypothetical protein [Rhodospirillales bacterium]